MVVQVEGADEELTDADLRPDALDQQRVEQLLAEHLPENNVAIITRNEFTEALRDFVDKVLPPLAHASPTQLREWRKKLVCNRGFKVHILATLSQVERLLELW